MTPIEIDLESFLNFLIKSISITFFKVHYEKSHRKNEFFDTI